jgi:hypothetical protein
MFKENLIKAVKKGSIDDVLTLIAVQNFNEEISLSYKYADKTLYTTIYDASNERTEESARPNLSKAQATMKFAEITDSIFGDVQTSIIVADVLKNHAFGSSKTFYAVAGVLGLALLFMRKK